MRSLLSRTLALTALLPLFVLTACGMGGGGEGATVVGTLEQGLVDDDVEVRVGGLPAPVAAEEDGRFAAADLPPGDIVVEIATDGLRGRIVIDDVEPGELVEVSVREEDGGIVIRVERRIVPEPAPLPPLEEEGPLVISAHHHTYRFAPGVYHGDVVVTGHHLTLLGSGHCGHDATVIDGDLIIEGHHIDIVGLTVLGRIDFTDSHHVDFTETCHEAGHDHHHHRHKKPKKPKKHHHHHDHH